MVDRLDTSSSPSPDALATLEWESHARSLHEQVAATSEPLRGVLALALNALGQGAFAAAAEHAEQALALDRASIVAWRIRGLADEGRHDGLKALEAYQAAYALSPDSVAILTDLGRLALALGLSRIAGEILAKALCLEPGSIHLAKQLSLALGESRDFAQAIALLREALRRAPENPYLWNALGAVVTQQGDTQNALIFFEESLRRAPDWCEALYNRAIAKLELGDLEGAEADCDQALTAAPSAQIPGVLFARAQARLAAGDLPGGWADYRARLHPDFKGAPTFQLDAQAWSEADPLEGARFLLVGEQGLGDEIMFAGMVPDLLTAIGPQGRLTLAVAPRLVALFSRSFPTVQVVSYEIRRNDGASLLTVPLPAAQIDAWAPMGALAARLRPSLASFQGGGYLHPDPQAAAYWRQRLKPLGGHLKVGLSWKSKNTTGHRSRRYAPFSDWGPVLLTKGVRFVNLQYGDCREEIAAAAALGVEIFEPDGLDLTNDLDAAAALSSGLDLVIGVGNASTNLAAATGSPAWFIFPPTAWPRLGAQGHPWFPRTRGFAGKSFGDWPVVLADVAAALSRETLRPS